MVSLRRFVVLDSVLGVELAPDQEVLPLRAAMRGSGAERVYVKVVERRSRDAERTYN